MFSKFVVTACLLAIVLCLVFPSSAYAYLDPGTGSYIFQLVLAGIVGLGFVIKVYWKRIRAFFSSIFSKDKRTEVGEDSDA